VDEEWLPAVTRHGWLIITRDRHIQDHRREIAVVREYGARMVALASTEARSVFAQLEVVMCQWRAIERRLVSRGPFIYMATRTSFKPMWLD
jgi:hypothetical protein